MTLDYVWSASIAGLYATVLLFSRVRASLAADEGYLWFGVQQLLRGRMPHRDFKSYEPGRYLWSAAITLIVGPGLFALRLATHLFFAIGLAAALFGLRTLGFDWASIALAGIALSMWSYPQHKQFECGLLLIAWAAFTHMLLHPSPATLAMAAAVPGAALVFGFNLFVYSSAALALTLSIATLTGRIALGLHWLFAGVLIGALPFLLFMLSPSFRRRFCQRRISSVLSRGSANLPLPVPWPWREPPLTLCGLRRARVVGLQWTFVALVAIPSAALMLAVMSIEQSAETEPFVLGMIAASVLAIVASHHAFSRADVSHLAQSIAPLWLVALLLAHRHAGIAGCITIATISTWLAWPLHTLWRRIARSIGCGDCNDITQRRIGGLLIDVSLVQGILFDRAVALCVGSRSRIDFFTAPFYPELYAVLSYDAPAYDTFCLHAADDRAQQEMIDAIVRCNVRSALISNEAFDGREELRFSRTHPLVWRHLFAHFTATACTDIGPDVVALTMPEDRNLTA